MTAEGDVIDEQGGGPRDGESRGNLDTIYQELLRRICTLEYGFQHRLRESELAREFGVSRTPIREVLQRLEGDGLVDIRHGVGSIVIAGDPDTLHDIYNLRIEIAELIPKLSPNAIEATHADAIIDLLGAVRETKRVMRPHDFLDLNSRLHRIVNSLIGNIELAKLHDLYYFKIAPFWYALAVEDFPRELKGLDAELSETLSALRSGDIRAVAYVHRNYTAYGMISTQRRLAVMVPNN